MILTPPQLRVLGSLIEKEITTPDQYPLSLNALQAATNQRSSRDPVLDLSEDEIRSALHALEDLGLAGPARGSVHGPISRVARFEHHARTVLHLRRDETAILCLLLLRGPQTPGELRSRADRLFAFDDLAAVTATLDRLAQQAASDPDRLAQRAASDPDRPAQPPDPTPDPGTALSRPLVAILPRQPGARESRYTHLLGDPAAIPSAPTTAGPAAASDLEARIADLERRLALLEARLPPA